MGAGNGVTCATQKDPGPVEISNYSEADLPDSSQLHNAPGRTDLSQVLGTSLPDAALSLQRGARMYHHRHARHACIMASLFRRSSGYRSRDEYLWGKDVLVAPVVEEGAASCQIYLPRGFWYDFWTGERIEGGVKSPVRLTSKPCRSMCALDPSCRSAF